MTEQLVSYKDEMLLLRWSESSRDGQTVTFQLPGIGEHPFKNSASGKKSGQRYMAVLVELNDDETPIPKKEEKLKGGPLSIEAAGLCKNERFQEYVAVGVGEKTPSEILSADFIRRSCRINSRAELDHNQDAASKFDRIKLEFLNWNIY